ncbi:MAG: restriction endonuclease [Duodenibacillus sp.]|nr:restriction endonuclease [Duodenibacillus sp.]
MHLSGTIFFGTVIVGMILAIVILLHQIEKIRTRRESLSFEEDAKREYRLKKASLEREFLLLEHQLKSRCKLKEDELNKERKNFEKYVRTEQELILNLKREFSTDVLAGRKWAAGYLADLYVERANLLAKLLAQRKHPALKAAEAVKGMRSELKELYAKNRLLEQKLKLYVSYFPFLSELDAEIMSDPSNDFEDVDQLSTSYDKARNYLSDEEYRSLSTTERNQLALDRYLSGKLGKVQIGRLYERYLGWLYEKNGYSVIYNGIEQGVEDMGRDLICSKPEETIIVQAKCWSQSKTIHEKHVYQLYGTMCTFKIEHPGVKKVRAVLYLTTQLSPIARQAAAMLRIKVEENFSLDKGFPMIKCNIGKSGEKIYHLPFDQQYDKTQIRNAGERYCTTVAEAEKYGFRRAKRFKIQVPTNARS